jgi:hypothetical protein
VPCLEVLEGRTLLSRNLGPVIDLSDPDVLASCGSNHAEKETQIAVNPTNSNNVVAIWWGGLGLGIVTAVTLDGGNNWQQVIIPGITSCTGGNYAAAFDPWLAFTPNGELYATSLPGSAGRSNAENAVVVSKSLDGGLHWGSPTVLDGAPIDPSDKVFLDKPTVTADPTNSSFVYAVWSAGGNSAKEGLNFSRTTNGGATWEPARRILDPGSGNQASSADIVVLPDGTLACVFVEVHGSDGKGTRENAVFSVIRSSDKGLTWSAVSQGPEVPIFQLTDPETGVPIDNNGSEELAGPVAIDRSNGNIYVVFEDNQFSGGQYSNIAFTMSTDGGLTWSAPIPVNQTPTSIPLRDQSAFIPSVAVAADGTIGVGYYDFRFNDLSPGLPTDYWMAFCHPSSKTPATNPTSWGSEVRLTDSSFNLEGAPTPTGAYFIGDYEGQATLQKDFLASWSQPVGSDPDSVFFRHVFADGGNNASVSILARNAGTAAVATALGITFTTIQPVGPDGGEGFGSGIFNDGPSVAPSDMGTPANLTVSNSTITGNQGGGGAAGSGGTAGQGIGGGLYPAAGGVECPDLYAVANIFGNTASAGNNDIFGN